MTHHIARNHVGSGVRVSWKIVPAVTEVWWAQSAHCHHRFPDAPGLRPITARAPKSLRPPELLQIRLTRLLGRESALEFGHISGILLHRLVRYILGLPESSKYLVQLFQTPDQVAILNEQNHDVRIVPLDGRPHVKPQIQQWMGDSRGRWEGDTLVVETIHFNGKHDQVGRALLSTGEHLSLVERFTRTGPETLLYEYTVTDPTIWVRPWTAQYPMQKNPELIYEFACHEGNYSMESTLSGARAIEKRAQAESR